MNYFPSKKNSGIFFSHRYINLLENPKEKEDQIEYLHKNVIKHITNINVKKIIFYGASQY